ncbi:RodZ domain-containing protein [Nitrosovibrio tenuis]|uniref:Cytoskeleton protein RodZ n=1 Tax=Nitrosovibrio tenuis TaxID=1233 RepID=A0A1H7GG46_9PROT|nr:RodZ family helix-turn-helix domain-containing protein [Nitrosovibrio tenuis]SEK37044.1 cytoskeleton protein RodZ [Nitrosovibrio tenuis]
MDSSDHNGAIHSAGAGAAPAEEGPGQLLRAARLERGLSIEDVARQLRLSVRQVTALEEDDYSKLSSATFLRGFIRNYAKLLQMDAKPLLQRIQESLPPPQTQTISYQNEGIPFPSGRNRGKRNLIIGAVIFMALLLLIYEIYRGNEVNMEKRQTDVRAETGTRTEPSDIAAPQFQSSPATATNRVVEADVPPAAKADVPPAKWAEAPVIEKKPATPPSAQQISPSATAPKPAIALPPKLASSEPENAAIVRELADNGENVMRLSFEGDAWVEIKDSRGKLLLSRINPRGTQQVVHGKPPFSLTVGNAAEVKLVYNNKPVDLAPYTNAYGGTARLSLE